MAERIREKEKGASDFFVKSILLLQVAVHQHDPNSLLFVFGPFRLELRPGAPTAPPGLPAVQEKAFREPSVALTRGQ